MSQQLDFEEFFMVLRSNTHTDHQTTIAKFMRDHAIDSLPELANRIALSNRTGWKETLVIIKHQTGYNLALPPKVRETAKKMNLTPTSNPQKLKIFEEVFNSLKLQVVAS